jgi:hypothetical protein
MKKSWNITEKIISTLIQAWAVFYLYSITEHVQTMLKLSQSGNLGYGLLVATFFVNYSLGIMAFTGGVALLYDKKWGWVLCQLCLLCIAGLMLINGREGLINKENTRVAASVSYLLVALGFIAAFVVLSLKPYRVKYKPTFLNWAFIIGVTIAVVAAKTVLPG